MTPKFWLAATASSFLIGVPAFAAAQATTATPPAAGSPAMTGMPSTTPAPAATTPPASSSMPDTPDAGVAADTGAAADTSASATTSVKVGATVNDAAGASVGTVSKLIPASGSNPAQVEITKDGKTKTVAASSLSASGSGLLWTDDSASDTPK